MQIYQVLKIGKPPWIKSVNLAYKQQNLNIQWSQNILILI